MPEFGPLQTRFPTTSWSVIATTGAVGETGREALADLCGHYWRPLYAYAQRKGMAPPDAEDAVQSFLAWVIEERIVERADRERGRFRTFLLTAFAQFLIRRHRYETASKRRPAARISPLEPRMEDYPIQFSASCQPNAEKLFEYTWAITVLERALGRLREEYAARGKLETFQTLRGCLSEFEPPSAVAASGGLGLTPNAVRVTLHRMRRRLAELLREEVACTLESEAEIEDELKHLIRALSLK